MVAEVVILLALIAVNGLLAMSELAVVSSRRGRLQAMAERGVNGARRALALASDPGPFLSTVQIGITLVGILNGAFSGAAIGARFSAWLAGQGMSAALADTVGFGSVVTLITYLSLVVGELVPKRVALRYPEGLACAVAPSMIWLAKAASPFVSVLDGSSQVLLHLLGSRGVAETEVTQEEIRTLVAEAESAGVIEPEERAMIARVMRLGDRPVRAVMTPRTEVDLVDLSAPPETIRARIAASPHSRLPAYDGSPETVLGVIQAKDFLDGFMRGGSVAPRAYLRTAPIVPETMDALEVVARLKDSTVHIGLVHDEYGNFQGVVTAADILEAIVGEFRTEEGPAEAAFTRRDDGSFLVAGWMAADELAEKLGFDLPEGRDYHTVAGLALALFGRLPQAGDGADAHGWRFEILDLDGRRIDKVLVSKPAARRRAVG